MPRTSLAVTSLGRNDRNGDWRPAPGVGIIRVYCIGDTYLDQHTGIQVGSVHSAPDGCKCTSVHGRNKLRILPQDVYFSLKLM